MQTDEEIQALLTGEALHGPRTWKGRPLAPYTIGLRDLALKVMSRTDTTDFQDFALVHILAEAFVDPAAERSARVARRTALLIATDDRDTFRAGLSLALDEFTDHDVRALRELAESILAPVPAAQVEVVAKKKDEPAAGESSPTPTS